MILALLIAQQDAPQPILPETNDTVWTLTTLLAIAIPVLLVVALVTYVRRTRGIADQAARDAAAALSASRSEEVDGRP